MSGNDSYMRINDLVENPTARIPVCLCLDTSGSMTRVVSGETQKTGETVFRDGKLWNVVTGGTSAIEDLVEGVRIFYDEIRKDDVARYSAEICVVTFGGQRAEIITDFDSIERQPEIPSLMAAGETPMGEAVNLALDCLEIRKNEYKDKGVDYYQPWLVLMTDGEANGSEEELERAIARTCELVQARKLTVFPIGFGPEAGMRTLARFSPTRPPIKVKDAKFNEFFQWLSQSVSRTSQSMPGEKVELDMEKVRSWGEL